MANITTTEKNPNLAEFELSMVIRGKSRDKFTDSVTNKVASSLRGIIFEKREIKLYVYISTPPKAATIISSGVYPITIIISSAICIKDNLNPLSDCCRNSCSLIKIFRALVINHPTSEKCVNWKTMCEKLKGLYSKIWNCRLSRKIFNHIISKLIFKFVASLIDLIIS